jgi:hypothetical protein
MSSFASVTLIIYEEVMVIGAYITIYYFFAKSASGRFFGHPI